MKTAVFSMLLTIFSLILHAQTAAQLSFQKAIEENEKDPENYLTPLSTLHEIKVGEQDAQGRNTWLQAMSTYYSFLGDYRKTLEYSDERFDNMLEKEVIECDTAFFSNYELRDAKTYLLDRATKEQIILLNEAHHIPYHRAFAFSLLEDLYQSGYHYIAIEALLDTTINRTKSVTDTAGYYTREPLFAELLRKSLQVGFQLIAYEPQDKCDNSSVDPYYCNRFRDSLMAKNISRIIEEDPDAKILVYAGYDHIHEGSKNGWKKMGSYIREMTGINPLSISQTKHIEYLHPQLETKEFTAVNNLGNIRAPVIALNKGSVWHDAYVDISIFHPRYLKTGSRPEFFTLFGNRHAYSLDLLDTKSAQWAQAFYSKDETGHRIPADQIPLSSKNNILYLHPGEYQIEFKDLNGQIIARKSIEVD